MKIFDATLARAERALDVRLQRHVALSSNIANVDTPNYVPKDVDFGAALASIAGAGGGSPSSAPAVTQPGHIDLDGRVVGERVSMPVGADGRSVPLAEEGGEAPTFDGNKVDLDRTMTELAQNAIQYGATARAAGKKLAMIRYAASDGGG